MGDRSSLTRLSVEIPQSPLIGLPRLQTSPHNGINGLAYPLFELAVDPPPLPIRNARLEDD